MAGVKVDELFWVLGANNAPLLAGVAQSTGKLRKFAAFMKTPIGALTALGVAATIAGAASVSMAAKLDKSLREVMTLQPQVAGGMRELRNEILALSNRVPEPPAQLTEGLYQVISAGVTEAAEAMTVLEVASRAAVGGISDTGTAVKAITTVMNAMGGSAGDATKIADIFFTTIRTGVIRFDELAENIGNVATSAGLAGISFEEVGAAMATMTKAGIGAAEATTALNRFILSVVQATDEQREAAKRMGFEFTTANLRTKKLSGFMEELLEATEGNIDALAELNPNIRAARAAFILAGSGAEEFSEILKEMEESTGAADEAFKEMNSTLQAQTRILRNRLGTIFQKIGAAILPQVIGTVRSLNFLVGLLVDTTERNVELEETLDAALRQTNEERERAARLTQDQIDAQEGLFAGLRQEIASLTISVGDDFILRLQAIDDQVQEVFGDKIPEAVKFMVDFIRGQFALLEEASDIDKGLDRLERSVEALGEVTTDNIKDFRELRNEMAALLPGLKAMRARVADGTEGARALDEAIDAVAKAVQELQLRLITFSGGAAARFERSMRDNSRTMEEWLDITVQAARIATDFAGALGVVDDKAIRVASSMANLAASIPGILSGDPASIAAGISALGNALGALFGDNAREQALVEAMRQNREAVDRLSRNIDGVIGRVLGGQQGGVLAGVQQALTQALTGREPGISGALDFLPSLNRELEALGLTMGDLTDIAAELGLDTENISFQFFRDLQEALASLQLERFFEGFTGQMELLRREFELFDIDDPLEKIRRLGDILLDMSNLDPNTIAGIRQALSEGDAALLESIIQQLFRDFQAGALGVVNLGDLTADQFLDLLGQLEGTLDELTDATEAEAATSAAFQITRTLTEVTGNRIAGILTTIAFQTERSADILALLAGLPGGGVLPPTGKDLGDVFRRVDPVIFSFGTLIGTVNIETTGATASQIGVEASEEIAEVVSRTLGNLLTDQLRSNGLGPTLQGS